MNLPGSLNPQGEKGIKLENREQAHEEFYRKLLSDSSPETDDSCGKYKTGRHTYTTNRAYRNKNDIYIEMHINEAVSHMTQKR